MEANALERFFKEREKENRLFILGDTASGKSTGTLRYFLGIKKPKIVYYVTTRKADLTEKKNFILENFKDYEIYFHDKPNSIDRINSGGKEDKPRIHLMTIEKALFYFMSQENLFKNLSIEELTETRFEIFNGSANIDQPELFILDEIDSMSENSNYELLAGYINLRYPNVKTIYISAVVNEEYVKTKLKDFLRLSHPDEDVLSIEKIEKKIQTHFSYMTSPLKDEVLKYLKLYSENKERFRQTIFIIPSINNLKGILKENELLQMPGFLKSNEKLTEEIEKTPELKDISNSFANLSTDLKTTLKHNFAIMYSSTTEEDRNVILRLFNAGKINLIASTNVIERGINVNANTLFLFETKQVHWTDRQLLNFYGRINRSIESNKLPGHFFFISNFRKKYSFSIFERRNLKIESILDAPKAALFCSFVPELENYLLLSPSKIEEYKKKYSKISAFADSIRFSVPTNVITASYKDILSFLNTKENVGLRRLAIKKIINNISETVIKENVIKYLYYKTIYTASGNTMILSDDSIGFVKDNVELLINELLKMNKPATIHLPNDKKGWIREEKDNIDSFKLNDFSKFRTKFIFTGQIKK
ncbi:MAG: helicase-related protein [Candidatus Aenigmatarchaeota archaeon]